MFSTLDSLVAATAFTVQNDVLPSFGNNRSLFTARIATAFVIVIQLILYLAISEYAKGRVDAVLYVCWSFQLALLPVVVGLLFGRGGRYWSRVASIVAGCIAAVVPLSLDIPDRVYELSPWLTVLVATTVYFVTGGARKIPEIHK